MSSGASEQKGRFAIANIRFIDLALNHHRIIRQALGFKGQCATRYQPGDGSEMPFDSGRSSGYFNETKERRRMRWKSSPDNLHRVRRQFVHLAVLYAFLSGVPYVAGEDNSADAGAAGTTLYVLTVDDVIHEGIFRAFADGFFILLQPGAQREICFAPDIIEGIFRRRGDAEAAKNDPAWAQKCLGVEPVMDDEHISALADAAAKTSPESRHPPPGGSPLEEEFFRQPPTPAEDSEKAFQQCIQKAKDVAKDYRRQGSRILGKRSKELAAMLSGLVDEPRLFLIADLYRLLILNAALSREILAVLQDEIPRLGLRDKMRLLYESRNIREKWESFWQRHEAVVASSDLPVGDKEQAKSRMQMLRAAVGLETRWRPPPTGEDGRGPGKKG